jgi:hypothetical protein
LSYYGNINVRTVAGRFAPFPHRKNGAEVIVLPNYELNQNSKTPLSDGHMTGLAVLVLREAGVQVNDPRLQKGIQWLLTNQRESGRWWTRSLNTDKTHYITYSGTAYPLLALMKCGVLPKKSAKVEH